MNNEEKSVKEKYTAMGFDVIKAGIPDLLLLKDGQIEFIEVKSSKDTLNENQERAFKILEKHGLSVRIERVPNITKEKEKRGRKISVVLSDEVYKDIEGFRQNNPKEDRTTPTRTWAVETLLKRGKDSKETGDKVR